MLRGLMLWPLRVVKTAIRGNTYPSRAMVLFSADGRLVLRDDSGGYVTYSRRDARTMTRRINQALDAWVKATP
jgi:hypothetical protein